MKVRLTNLTLDCDADLISGVLVPSTPPPVVVAPVVPALPPDPGPGPSQLPVGYDSDKSIGNYMLVTAMAASHLTPIGVQHHGPDIIKALKASYPDLDVYLSPSDAPVWPHWGSLDVTVNSGIGGWSFRPDGVTAWQPVGQR